uniref:Ras-related protein n=1 Tax=Coptotermes formosanus TaxID=36987 RepID=L0ATE1_COPFO|nr:Ras-related protein [Coptotermes formosanus]
MTQKNPSVQEEYSIKLILIGDSSVGKTSLIMRYIDDKFSPNNLSTIGVDFKTKYLEIDGHQVKVQVWDTAGQEQFRAITRAYYRNSNGILIVFDLTNRETFNQVKVWLQSIHDVSVDAVDVILCGNKVDLERAVSREEVEEFASLSSVPYFETSCKLNTGINEMFMELATRALRRKIEGNRMRTSSNKDKVKLEVERQNNGRGCCKN